MRIERFAWEVLQKVDGSDDGSRWIRSKNERRSRGRAHNVTSANDVRKSATGRGTLLCLRTTALHKTQG